METKFQTSFIPKKTPNATVATGGIENKGPSILMVIATAIFFAVILFGAFVFIYKSTLSKTITAQKAELLEAKEKLDADSLIANATRLNDRILGIEQKLQTHVAPTNLLELLERNTLKTVTFNNFTFSYDPKEVTISGSGQGLRFSSIVLQSDRFGEAQFRDVVFSNLGRNETGFIDFSFQGKVDVREVQYAKSFPSLNNQNNNQQP